MLERLALAVLPVVAFAVPTPAPASAHATLQASSPEAGAHLAGAPARVVLRFSEPVETALGAVEVVDAGGEEVQRGTPFHPGGDTSSLAVRVRAPRGGFTVTYRVVSEDSHRASGGFGFRVGPAGPAAGPPVAELLSRGGGGVTSAALTVVRAVEHTAIAVAAGVLVVLLAVWLPALAAVSGADGAWSAASECFARRAGALLVVAAAAGCAAATLALPLQAATIEDGSLWSAAGDAPQVLSTRFGAVWGVAAIAWLALLTVAAGNRDLIPALRVATVGAAGLALPRGRRGWFAAAGVPVLWLVLVPALSGHASTRGPVAVLLVANVAHVAAAGAWIGGLVVLAVALPAAGRRLPRAARAELDAAILARFSTVALVAVSVLLAGGIVQSAFELEQIGDLTGTPFGRAVSVKVVLVVALLACGAVNHRRLRRRVLVLELILGAAVLAVSGLLAGYAP